MSGGLERLMRSKESDLRPFVARYVERLLEEAQRASRASYAKQLAAAGLAHAEAAQLRRALVACRGNKSEAARLLAIDRRSLQRKLARLARRQARQGTKTRKTRR
jgi:ActR/RegA family two-component response regulator